MLAKLVAWRKVLHAELDILRTGRKDLNDHIERLEREKVKGEAEINHTADNVLSRIRQGLAWTIVPSRPAPDYSNELDIANAALRQLDAEIAGKEAVLALGPRVAAVARLSTPAPYDRPTRRTLKL